MAASTSTPAVVLLSSVPASTVPREGKDEKEVLSLDDTPTPPIKLISKDKKEYVLDRKYASVSNLVKTTLETDKSADEVPIPGVSGAILEEVVSYMNRHKGTEPPIVEKPLRSKAMKDVCKEPLDADFIDRIGENRQMLYDLILAANYMHINSLLHLGCAKVASLIKGQPLEKIKDILSTRVGAAGGAKEEKKEEKADVKV